jgi:hypothetical protein
MATDVQTMTYNGDALWRGLGSLVPKGLDVAGMITIERAICEWVPPLKRGKNLDVSSLCRPNREVQCEFSLSLRNRNSEVGY